MELSIGKSVRWDLFGRGNQWVASSCIDYVVSELSHWRGGATLQPDGGPLRPLDVYVAGEPFEDFSEDREKQCATFDYFLAYVQVGAPTNRYRFLTKYPDRVAAYARGAEGRVAKIAKDMVERQTGTNLTAWRPHVSAWPTNVMAGALLDSQDGAAVNRVQVENLCALPFAERWLSLSAVYGCPAFDGFVEGRSFAQRPSDGRTEPGVVDMVETRTRRIHWIQILGTREATESAVVQCAETSTPLMVCGVLPSPPIVLPDDPNVAGVSNFPASYRIRQWPVSYGLKGLTPIDFESYTEDQNVLILCDCGNADLISPTKSGRYDYPCSDGCGRTMFPAYPGGKTPDRLRGAAFVIVKTPNGIVKTETGVTVTPLDGVTSVDGGKYYMAPLTVDAMDEVEAAPDDKSDTLKAGNVTAGGAEAAETAASDAPDPWEHRRQWAETDEA